MTGGGPRRGPGNEPGRPGGTGGAPRDAWRGVRDSSRGTQGPAPATGSTGSSADAELEELPPQPVVPRGSSGLGLGGTLAVVAIVALLGAGFGLLGGRPESTPRPTAAAVASVTEPTPASAASPRVTPWTECAAPPTEAPRMLLQVNGEPFESADREPIEIPVDVITEIWVEGGACALEWTIDLENFRRLDTIRNQAGDAGYAAQNRFAVLLVPYDGGDFVLRAELGFGEIVAEATWPIRILPIDRPRASLLLPDFLAAPVAGCDVTLFFGSGRSEPLNRCVDDIGEPPRDAIPVRSGTRIEFALADWQLDDATATCGRLSGQSFIVQPRPGCSHELEARGMPLAFEAPAQNGLWTVAFSACASRPASRGSASNRVCGTWYANIAVTDDR